MSLRETEDLDVDMRWEDAAAMTLRGQVPPHATLQEFCKADSGIHCTTY